MAQAEKGQLEVMSGGRAAGVDQELQVQPSGSQGLSSACSNSWPGTSGVMAALLITWGGRARSHRTHPLQDGGPSASSDCSQDWVAPAVVTPKGLVQPREAVRRGGGFVITGKSTSGLNRFFWEGRKLLMVTGADDKQQLDHEDHRQMRATGRAAFPRSPPAPHSASLLLPWPGKPL